MKMKKIAAVLASVLAANTMLTVPFTTSAAAMKIEAESGTLTGTGGVKTDVAGFSGDGYMYLEDNGDVIDIPVTVDAAGMYTLTICYQNDFGTDKIQNIVVNDVDQGQMSFPVNPDWSELKFGNVKLNAGENTIRIKGSWGWTNFDYITLEEASMGTIKATQTNTCDAKATEETKKVMAYLASVYGKNILSGQQEIYHGGPHDEEYEFNLIKEKTGKLPAIRGFDLGNSCNPITSCFGEDGASDRMVEWAAKGGIVTCSFHLNVPKDFASYTAGTSLSFGQTTYNQTTDFSPSKAIQKGTKEYEFYTAALDKAAEKFNMLEEKGIPVLWRPLHEAEGGGGENGSWFWWGREGSKAYRELYQFTWKYLTEEKNCHNLIWEFNSYNYATSTDWYPGDAYVDIIGYDKYNCTDWSTGSKVVKHNDSAISSTFYGIMEKYNSAKMVAMMENDSFSTPENLQAEKAGWLYFCTWYDGGGSAESDQPCFLSDPAFNTEEALIDMYTSDYCITLDELPKFSDIEVDPDATNPTENTEPVEPEEGHGKVVYDKTAGKYTITIPKASDSFFITVEVDGADNGGGCVAATYPKDGHYYWGCFEWKTTKTADIEIDFDKNFKLSLTEDGETTVIEDEELIAEAIEYFKGLKQFEGQVWWAQNGEEKVDLSTYKITDAYIKESAEEPTEEQDPTEATEATEEKPTEEKPTEELPEAKLYGDVDGSGKVDILDVITLNKSLMIGEVLTAEGKANADVDKNGVINETDSLNILKFVVELITLPVE